MEFARRISRRLRRESPAATPYRRLQPLDTPRLVRVPPLRPTESDEGHAPRLTVLLPALQADRLTGGPNTALNLAGRLVADGLRVRLVSTIEAADPDLTRIRDQIRRLTDSSSAAQGVELTDATVEGLAIEPDEVLLATWWPTAYVAREALRLTRAPEFVYLIQDYEPGFHAWSTNYVLAEATYGFPHRAIYNEAVLAEWFGRRGPGGRTSYMAFEPAIDRARFRPAEPGERALPHRLLFYARPQAERNGFELGLYALRLAAARGAFRAGRWTAQSVGAPLPDLALSKDLTMVNGPWLGLDDWAAQLRGSDLLLSLMISPHTSYPPLEMAACGGLVVTNSFGSKTADVFRAISRKITAVAPEPEALAAALADTARLVEEGGRRRVTDAEPRATIDLPGSWDEAFRDVLPWLTRSVRELSGRS